MTTNNFNNIKDELSGVAEAVLIYRNGTATVCNLEEYRKIMNDLREELNNYKKQNEALRKALDTQAKLNNIRIKNLEEAIKNLGGRL